MRFGAKSFRKSRPTRVGGGGGRQSLSSMVDAAVRKALGRGGGRGPMSRRGGQSSRRGRSMAPGSGREVFQDVDYGRDVDEESSFRRGSRGPLRVGHRM